MFRKKRTEEPLKALWYTNMPGLVESWPILPARKAFPSWYNQAAVKVPLNDAIRPPGAPEGHGHGHQQQGRRPVIERAMQDTPTIRGCPGMLDLMRTGYVLRAWTDVEINTGVAPGDPEFPDAFDSFTGLPGQTKVKAFGALLNQTYPFWPGEYDFALKLDSPWVCKLPPGWSLIMLPMPYEGKQPFRVIPGIIDADEFHVINVVATWSNVGPYIIEAGTPLALLVPVRREGFQMDMECHFDSTRFDVLSSVGKGAPGGGRILLGGYVRERIKRQKQQKATQSCPFH